MCEFCANIVTMSRDKLNVKNAPLCPAAREWVAGKYSCLLVQQKLSQDRTFIAWADKTVSELEPILSKLQIQCGVPPEQLLNILGTYKSLLVYMPKKKNEERAAREQERRHSVLFKRAAMAFDQQRRKLNLSGAWRLGLSKRDSDKWRSAANELRGLTRPHPVGACAIILADLFRRHRVRPIWPTIGKIMRIAFPEANINEDGSALEKTTKRWAFEINLPRSDLFESPPSNPLLLLLGPPTATQRLVLLRPRVFLRT